MKNLIFLFSVIFFKSYSQQAITANAHNGFSVGQILSNSTQNATGSVEYGVQHGYKLTVGSVSPSLTFDIEARLYPNPATEYILINIPEIAHKKLKYSITDLFGKEIIQDTISSINTKIDLTLWNAGTYLIQILDNNQSFKTFKLIKN